MTKTKYYTVGQILRLGLLKNHQGKPYKNKITITRAVKRIAKKIKTPYGEGYAVSEADIKKLNNRWK